MEQHLDQRRRIGADLLGQIGQRCASGEPDFLPVALLDAYATNRWRLHLVELLTPLLLRLTATSGRATGTTESTLGATTTTPAAAATWWWTARPAARPATTRCAGAGATTAGRGAATTCTWAGGSAAQLT